MQKLSPTTAVIVKVDEAEDLGGAREPAEDAAQVAVASHLSGALGHRQQRLRRDSRRRRDAAQPAGAVVRHQSADGHTAGRWRPLSGKL